MSETKLGIVYLEFGRLNSSVWMTMKFRHRKWTQFQGRIARVSSLPQNFPRDPARKGSKTSTSYRFELATTQTGHELVDASEKRFDLESWEATLRATRVYSSTADRSFGLEFVLPPLPDSYYPLVVAELDGIPCDLGFSRSQRDGDTSPTYL
jgi:hypothetical protein